MEENLEEMFTQNNNWGILRAKPKSTVSALRPPLKVAEEYINCSPFGDFPLILGEVGAPILLKTNVTPPRVFSKWKCWLEWIYSEWYNILQLGRMVVFENKATSYGHVLPFVNCYCHRYSIFSYSFIKAFSFKFVAHVNTEWLRQVCWRVRELSHEVNCLLFTHNYFVLKPI